LRDLTQHLTTRTDDSHAAPHQQPFREDPFQSRSAGVRAQVRFFALHRIKPHAPPLVRAPVNSFEFQPCDRTPQVECLTRLLGHSRPKPRTPSTHRLGRGLPGYLILFAPHAFVPQRQFLSSHPPTQLVFLVISTHFTATPRILVASPGLKTSSIKGSSPVKPRAFTTDLLARLHTLYTQ
jgi:hypothetical protein